MPPVKIALIGDRNERVTAHVAISLALDFAARQMDRPVTWQWLDTDVLSSVVARDLAGFSGVWCVPASPYRNMENALSAIRWARENKVPFLGTCGGYQHAIIEFARNVLGLAGAGSTEIDPDTQLPLISPLSCALIEQSDGIVFSEDSAIAKIHDGRRVHEKYHCSYGINPEFIGLLDGQKLSICGWDEHDEPKAVELKDHPFFFGTAYQPERSALSGQTHPLIIAFVQAAARHAERGDAGRAAVEASATGSETG